MGVEKEGARPVWRAGKVWRWQAKKGWWQRRGGGEAAAEEQRGNCLMVRDLRQQAAAPPSPTLRVLYIFAARVSRFGGTFLAGICLLQEIEGRRYCASFTFKVPLPPPSWVWFKGTGPSALAEQAHVLPVLGQLLGSLSKLSLPRDRGEILLLLTHRSH